MLYQHQTLEYFIELKELIKKGRDNKRCTKLEQACLALVQKENEVLEEEEEEDAEGSSKKKKRKEVVLPEEIKMFGDEKQCVEQENCLLLWAMRWHFQEQSLPSCSPLSAVLQLMVCIYTYF